MTEGDSGRSSSGLITPYLISTSLARRLSLPQRQCAQRSSAPDSSHSHPSATCVHFPPKSASKSNLITPRSSKIPLQRPPRHIKSKEGTNPPNDEGQQRGEEQFRPRHERQSTVTQVRDVDILRQSEEEQAVAQEERAPVPPHDQCCQGKQAEVEGYEQRPKGVHGYVERVAEFDPFSDPRSRRGEEESVCYLVVDQG